MHLVVFDSLGRWVARALRSRAEASLVPEGYLLSHRLRGYASAESSLSALGPALASGRRHLEVDTRLTRDDVIVVYHDAWWDTQTTAAGRVADYDWSQGGAPAFQDSDGERVATLDDFLDAFAARCPSDAGVTLHLDMKDPGAEAEHLTAIERHGLRGRVALVSWWPEALRRAHALDPRMPLFFSHVPLTGANAALRPVLAAMSLPGVRATVERLAAAVAPGWMRELQVSRLYTNDENRELDENEHRGLRGLYPSHFVDDVVRGEIAQALVRSGGGVNVPWASFTRGLAARLKRRGLRVGVFSVDTPLGAALLNRLGGEIIYADRPF